MKFLIPILTFVLVMGGLYPTVHAQEEGVANRILMVDYFKVPPGGVEEYLALEAAWKKIHAANIEAGKYAWWSLERMVLPRGSQAEYNYVTVTCFDNSAQLARHLSAYEFPANMDELITSEEQALMQRTEIVREWVKSEIYSRTDAHYGKNMDDTKVVVFNYFDYPETGGAAQHRQVERDIWKPVHQARIEAGGMIGWALFNVDMPWGAGQPYHGITVDLYSSMEQYLDQGSPIPILEQLNPGTATAHLLEQTNNAATLIHSEVRMIIDEVAK